MSTCKAVSEKFATSTCAWNFRQGPRHRGGARGVRGPQAKVRQGSRIIEDHTQDPLPEAGQVPREPQEDGQVGETDQEGLARGQPRARLEEPETPVVFPPVVLDPEPVAEMPETPALEQAPVALEVDAPQRARQRTTSTTEPEVEEGPSLAEAMPPGSARTAGEEREARLNAGVAAANANANLDGVPLSQARAPQSRGRAAPGFGPQRPRIEDNTVNPYLRENELFMGEAEKVECSSVAGKCGRQAPRLLGSACTSRLGRLPRFPWT